MRQRNSRLVARQIGPALAIGLMSGRIDWHAAARVLGFCGPSSDNGDTATITMAGRPGTTSTSGSLVDQKMAGALMVCPAYFECR